MRAWDDVSGLDLDPREVMKARKKEVGFIDSKGVWKKISRIKLLLTSVLMWTLQPIEHLLTVTCQLRSLSINIVLKLMTYLKFGEVEGRGDCGL